METRADHRGSGHFHIGVILHLLSTVVARPVRGGVSSRSGAMVIPTDVGHVPLVELNAGKQGRPRDRRGSAAKSAPRAERRYQGAESRPEGGDLRPSRAVTWAIHRGPSGSSERDLVGRTYRPPKIGRSGGLYLRA